METTGNATGTVVTFTDSCGRSDGAPALVYRGGSPEDMAVALAAAYRAAEKALKDMEADAGAMEDACGMALRSYESVLEAAFGIGAASALEEWLAACGAAETPDMVTALGPVIRWVAGKFTEAFGYAPFGE